MASLTTSSSWSEFDADLHRLASKLEYNAEELATRHKNMYHQQRMNYDHREFIPDRDAFLLSFTVLVSNLRLILSRISDLEDLTDSLDEEDETELVHHNGEIFALKSMYLEMVRSHEALEARRLIGTGKGMHLRNFLYAVASKAVPNIDDIYGGGQLLVNGSITANRITTNHLKRATMVTNTTPKWSPTPMLTPPPMPQAFANP